MGFAINNTGVSTKDQRLYKKTTCSCFLFKQRKIAGVITKVAYQQFLRSIVVQISEAKIRGSVKIRK